MLTLNLAEGGQTDIPFASVLLIEETDKDKVTIVYNLDGQQNQADLVTDNYGFLKKKLIDNMALVKPVEVTKEFEKKKQRLYISETYIVARRDITDKENPHKTRLTLNVRGPIFNIEVLETRAKLDGED